MMRGRFVLMLFVLVFHGVFGDEVKTVSVKKGDSVTLNSDVTKQPHEVMRWYFNGILIAYINGHPSTSCLYDGEDGIFRDRLEPNQETGSLTITNIRSEHTGRYELEFIKSDGTGTSTSLNRNRKCDRTRIISKPISADDDIIKSFRLIVTVTVSVKKGDSVTLNSDVTKQHHEIMRWYFNKTLIAHINGHPSTSCLYDGEGGIFRERLEPNQETGSLTITNTRSEHTGHYELEFIISDGTGTSTSLNRNSKCDRTRIISKPISADDDIIKSFRLIVSVTVSVKKGDSVTLNSDVTKRPHEIMRWYFNGILIAYINGHPNTSCLFDGEGGIFRDRLKPNYETGSLNITNIRSEHTGHYELEFIKSDGTGTSTSLNRNSKCNRTRIIRKPISADRIIKSFNMIVTAVPDSDPFPAAEGSDPFPAAEGVVAGIFVVVGVLLVFVAVAAVGVIYYRRRTAKKVGMKNNQGTDGKNSSQDPLVKPEV